MRERLQHSAGAAQRQRRRADSGTRRERHVHCLASQQVDGSIAIAGNATASDQRQSTACGTTGNGQVPKHHVAGNGGIQCLLRLDGRTGTHCHTRSIHHHRIRAHHTAIGNADLPRACVQTGCANHINVGQRQAATAGDNQITGGSEAVRSEVVHGLEGHVIARVRAANRHATASAGGQAVACRQHGCRQFRCGADEHVAAAGERTDRQRAVRAADFDIATGRAIHLTRRTDAHVQRTTGRATDVITDAEVQAVGVQRDARQHTAQAAIGYIQHHGAACVQVAEAQVTGRLAQPHLATGRSGAHLAIHLHVEQVLAGATDVAADVTAHGKHQVTACTDGRPDQASGLTQISIHRQPQVTQVVGAVANGDACHAEIPRGLQVTRPIGADRQVAGRRQVQRRRTADSHGTNVRRGEFARRCVLQQIERQHVAVCIQQFHVTWGIGQQQGTHRFEVIAEASIQERCERHFKIRCQTAHAVTRGKRDVHAGYRRINLANRRLRGLKRCCVERIAQIIAVPHRIGTEAGRKRRGRIKRERVVVPRAAKLRQRIPIGAVSLVEPRRDVCVQLGQVGAHVRAAASRKGLCRECLLGGAIRDITATHDLAVADQAPVHGVVTGNLPFIGRDGVRNTRAIQLQTLLDRFQLFAAQSFKCQAAAGVDNGTIGRRQPHIAAGRVCATDGEVACIIAQHHVALRLGVHQATGDAAVAAPGFNGIEHQRRRAGTNAAVGRGAFQPDVAPADGRGVALRAGDAAAGQQHYVRTSSKVGTC